MARISSYRETGERYPVLRLLATICQGFGLLLLTLGAIVLIVGIGSLFAQVAGPFNGPYGFYAGVGVIWAVALFAAGIQSFAVGSFFRLAIHVEENTRATAQSLDRLRSSLEPKAEVDRNALFLS